MRIYVRTLTHRQKDQAIREGRAHCCNIAHGDNPPVIDFERNPAALDALMRKGWAVCGNCYRRYFANGHHPKVSVQSNGGISSLMGEFLTGQRKGA